MAGVRRALVVIAVLVAACSDSDPPYADPSAIAGKHVPGVVTTDFFTGGYDPANPPPPAKDPSQEHADRKQIALTPDTQCFTCHGGAGPGSPAVAAGYVAAKGATQPAPNADVVILDGTNRIAGKTGKDGFFWIAAGTPLGAGARTGVRDAQGNKAEMSRTLPNGGCTASTCHGSKEPNGIIVVPQ